MEHAGLLKCVPENNDSNHRVDLVRPRSLEFHVCIFPYYHGICDRGAFDVRGDLRVSQHIADWAIACFVVLDFFHATAVDDTHDVVDGD